MRFVLVRRVRPARARRQFSARMGVDRPRWGTTTYPRVTRRLESCSELYLSASSVDFHMRNILAKLHLRNRAQVVAWAVEHGLVTT